MTDAQQIGKQIDAALAHFLGLDADKVTPQVIASTVAVLTACMSEHVDSNEAHFSAASIGEAAAEKPLLKAALQELSPSLWRSVVVAERENTRRMAIKEVRKAVDFSSALNEALQTARSLSAAEAAAAARQDGSDVAPMIDDARNRATLADPLLDEMALRYANNPDYAAALEQAAPAIAAKVAAMEPILDLPMMWEVPMQSMTDCRMVFNNTPGMAGPEIVHADGNRTGFGGIQAIERFAVENNLTSDDLDCLSRMDSLVDVRGLRAPAPVIELPKPLLKFIELALSDKAAALDAHTVTGEVVCLRTINLKTRAEGNGTPPIPWSDPWRRLASCSNGTVLTTGVQDEDPVLMDALSDFVEVAHEFANDHKGAKLHRADTQDGKQHFGDVAAVTRFFTIQNAGRGEYALHESAALDSRPVGGHSIEVKYKNGRGAVENKSIQRVRDSVER